MSGFRLPTRVHLAPGVLERLPEVASSLGLTRVLLVVDPGLAATAWPATVEASLEGLGLTVVVFDAVESNPRTTTAERAAELARSESLDGVVGLGGGSVLDAAKAAAMLATNGGQAQHYEGKNRYPEKPLPYVAIPTTCGTGSEVTWVAVLTYEATRAKISVKGETMFPDHAVVDADLLTSLPADLVAWTALDALTHALEATTGNKANAVSDALAEKAIVLLFTYLERAVADVAGDGEAREAVMRASTLAGIAFGNADVGGVHCLSESAGGLLDVPHGLANAVLLLPVMRYHLRFIAPRLAALEDLFGGASAADAGERAERFLERLDRLARALRVPAWSTLAAGADPAEIAKRAVQNGSNGSNPQPMLVRNYLEILAGLG